MTIGVFMETNLGFPNSPSRSHRVASTASPPPLLDQYARLTDAAAIVATRPPEFVTTNQPVSIDGEALPVGTRLQLVARQGPDAWVRYKGGEYAIPISATDLK